jgi:dienelactone hydrolase
LVVITGCGGDSGSDETLLDPSQPGEYEIGFTDRSVTRALANGEERTVSYLIWYPAAADNDSSPGPAKLEAPPADGVFPLVVFSHGFGGGPRDSSFLHEHLASHGFIVAAAAHGDCHPECPSTQADLHAFTDRRVEDVDSVLEDVLALNGEDDAILGGRVDSERLGVAGFSCGGYTAIRAGENDERLVAILALAPSCGLIPLDPVEVNKRLMIVQGELDSELPIAFNASFYANIPPEAPDHWFVSLHGAGHSIVNACVPFLTRAPRCEELLPHDDILASVRRWSTAFLRAFVAKDENYVPLTRPDANEDPNVSVILTRQGDSPSELPTVVPVGVTPTPGAPAGAVLFEEDLQTPTGALPELDESGYSSGYEGSGYNIATESKAEGTPRARVVVPGTFGDISISVDALLTSPADDQYVGIACRSQDGGNNYEFGILPNLRQYYLIQSISGQFASLIGGIQKSPEIRGGNETNHLELTCRGTVIEASINGVMVASVSAGAFNDGEVWFGAGQFVESDSGPDTPVGSVFEVRFTNLVVRQE